MVMGEEDYDKGMGLVDDCIVVMLMIRFKY